jgi:hypothetical protein
MGHEFYYGIFGGACFILGRIVKVFVEIMKITLKLFLVADVLYRENQSSGIYEFSSSPLDALFQSVCDIVGLD